MRTSGWLAAVCLAISGGCASPGQVSYNTSESQEEAASVHVAVQSVQAWDDAKVLLSTGFKLSEAEALAASLPTTSLQEQETARRVMASLGISTPQTTVEKTSTYEDDRLVEGVEADSSARKTTTSRAEAPTPEQASVARASAKIPDALRTLQSDPFIQAQTARNLIHYYALLNQEIDNVALPEGSEAYLVRLQVTVSPNKRRQPYDITIDLGAFNSEEAETVTREAIEKDLETDVRGPQLLPLVITDQVERSLQSQAELVAMQLALSARGGVGQAAASGAAGYASESARNALGAQYNSLYSLAQLNANTLRVRFGAQSIGGTYETVTRNHLVTFLMIVPRKVAQSSAWRERRFELVTRAYVSDARDGRRMEIASELDSLQATGDEFGHFYDVYEDFVLNCNVAHTVQHQNFGKPHARCASNTLWGETRDRVLYSLNNNDAERRFITRRIAHLAKAAQDGDFPRFREIVGEPYVVGIARTEADCKAMGRASPRSEVVTGVLLARPDGAIKWECLATPPVARVSHRLGLAAKEARIKTLYLELQRLRGAPKPSSFVTLPRSLPSAYPDLQTPLVHHDDKASQVRLHGGRGLDKRRLAGVLVISPGDGKTAYTLPASTINYDGRKVDLAFVPLAQLGAGLDLTKAEMRVCLRDPDVAATTQDALCPPTDAIEGAFQSYVAIPPLKKDDLTAAGSLSTSSDTLTAVAGVGTLRLQVALAPGVTEATLSLKNASLKGATGPGQAKGLGRRFTLAEANDAKPAIVILELENLNPGSDVMLTLTPGKGLSRFDPEKKSLSVVAAPKV